MMKGFGGMDFNKLMKQAQQMQKGMAAMQEELKERIVEAEAGGGMVKVKVNGRQELLQVKLEKEIVDPENVEMLEDLIVAAVSQGMKKAKELSEQEYGKLTGGVMPPGMMPGM